MACEHIQGVVHASRFVEQVNAAVADQGGDESDEQAVAQAHKSGGRGDGHQAHHSADARPNRRHLAVAVTVEENPRDHGRGRGQVGVGERQHRVGARREGRPRVEAKPSEPQQSGSQNHKRDVRRGLFLLNPPPQEQRPCQRRASRRHVHHRAAGEIEHAPRAKQSLRVPSHVAERWVHHQREQDHEQDVGAEAHAARHAARDERGGDDGELQLEQGEQQKRHGAGKVCVGAEPHIPKCQERPRVSHDASQAVAKAQAEPDKHPQHTDDA